MADHVALSAENPVLIIGAGISGLVLAQHFRREGIPFQVFERDADLTTRGVGWGLTLHWSLPALRALLPETLIERLPESYVNRPAVEEGASSTFPFLDLSSGELKFSTPKATQSDRIRVTREELRRLLSTGIEINWKKSLNNIDVGPDSVSATFEDGSSIEGYLLVACDGAQSLARRIIFPSQWETYKIPVRLLGLKVHLSPEQMKPILDLDPFFLQGTSSENDSFIYVSVLDAPGNRANSSDKYTCQICVSWPYREGFLGDPLPTEAPNTSAERYEFIQKLADTWAEPFRSLARSIPKDELIKDLIPQDFVPPQGLRSTGRAVLMGDAIHAMAMFRGEGANHSIVDVHDFVERVLPYLKDEDPSALRTALDEYEDAVISRSGPGVLASRQACIDAHDWQRINSTSPLLTKRERYTKF